MKILHLIFSFNTGGAETMLVDIANEQMSKDEVFLIIINNSYSKKMFFNLDDKVKLIVLNRKPGSRNPLPLFKLNKILYNIKPDIIHCHNENLVNTLCPIFRKNLVVTIHGLGRQIINLKKYKKIFAISNGVAQDIKKRGKISPIVIYNGINVERIISKSTYNKCNVYKIIQVGRLNHEIKGQNLLIKAIKILHDTNEIYNIMVDFIGEGSSEEYLKKLVYNYNLSNRVKFLGLKDREYIYRNLCNYDLLVQPSLYEGFGLTIAEAMAAKVPVLVSNIHGPMEIIANGEHGFWFDRGSAESLAESIKNLIEIDEKILRAKIETAFDFVKEKFSIVSTASNYIHNYIL